MKSGFISVKDLKKKYGTHSVLSGFDFDVDRGSIFALLGENGAGKTTTIRILSTLIKAEGGTATIAGFDCKHNASDIRKIISLTGQDAALDELLTGKENLQMMGRMFHLDRKTVKKRTSELLEQFDLIDASNRPVKTYSGGMKRRLDIAISLLGSPQVIFLDEPTTGLDPRSRMNTWGFIRDLAKKGVTIFLTTQYLEEADHLADKIAVINDGKIVAIGTANELKSIVGEEQVVLHFQQLDFQKASMLLNGRMNNEDQTVSIKTNGSSNSLRLLLNVLHDHEIEPMDIQFHKPTLDDVFMDLTNRSEKGVALS